MMQMGNNDHCPSRAGFALDMTDLFRMCASGLPPSRKIMQHTGGVQQYA